MTERQMYTVREFCERNAISRATFYRMLAVGEIKVVKVGKRTLVPAASEREWHASSCPCPCPCPEGESEVRHRGDMLMREATQTIEIIRHADTAKNI